MTRGFLLSLQQMKMGPDVHKAHINSERNPLSPRAKYPQLAPGYRPPHVTDRIKNEQREESERTQVNIGTKLSP